MKEATGKTQKENVPLWESRSGFSLSSSSLKTIAMALMLLDHSLVVFLPADSLLRMVLRIPGRIVAPIFCFLVAEGYHYTSSRKKYMLRLFVFALISHVPFNITFNYPLSPLSATSVMWSLVLGLAALTAVKSSLHTALKALILVACCAAAYTANWNYVAVLWIVVFGIFRGSFKRQMLAFCAVGTAFLLAPAFLRFALSRSENLYWFHVGIFLAVPVLAMYNGRLGKKSRFMSIAFYIFYPAHLILLHILNIFTLLAKVMEALP